MGIKFLESAIDNIYVKDSSLVDIKIILIIFFSNFHFLVSFAQQYDPNSISCIDLPKEVDKLLDQDEYENAHEILDFHSKNLDVEDHLCRAYLSFLRGKLNYYEGDAAISEAYLQEAMTVCQTLRDEQICINVAYHLALVNLEEGRKGKAEKLLDQIIVQGDKLINHKLFFEIFETRSMLHSQAGNHRQAMICLRRAFNYLNKHNKSDYLQIQILNQLATNYQTLGKVDSSIFYYNILLDLKIKTNDKTGLLSDYSTVGGLYNELGNYKGAQNAFVEAIKIAEFLQDTMSLLTIYKDMSKIYLEQRLIDPALDYVEKAISLSKEKGALLSEGQSYQIRASIFEISNKPERAMMHLERALRIFKKLGMKKEVADIQLELAEILGQEQNLDEAESALREALDIRLETADEMGELNIKLALTKLLLKTKKNKQECHALLQDCSRLINDKNIKSKVEFLRLQSIFEEQEGDYRQSLLNYKSYNQLRDSILNKENAEIVRDLEVRYKTAEKDKALALQDSKIGKQSAALKKRNTQIVQLMTGLLVIFILGFLAFVTYQRNRIFNRQKLSVIEKERETQVLRAMVSGEEQERRRIARDLHDGLGANLATVKMRINALRNHIPNLDKVESYLKAEELIDDACDNIREISHNMMPGSLNKYGLEVALQDMCEAIEKANQIEVSLILHGLDQLIDDIIEINVYRIVQELLKNVLKHADAKEIIVQLSLEEEFLNVVVEDDGKGFNLEKLELKKGIGLESIHSRVIYLDGEMKIDSNPGKGSSININIPIQSNQKSKLWSKS